MKKLFALLLAAAMLLGVFAGCSQDGPSGDNSTDVSGNLVTGQKDPNKTYLKEYQSTYSSSITSMNPYTTKGTSDYIFIANLVDGLVETDRYGRAVPSLATEWKHNDDYSVWTFTLRPDVYWVDHTGAKTEYKVTADDFVNGIRYVAEPNHSASSFSTIRSVIAGLYNYYYLLVDIDDGTVTDTTREAA